MVAGMPASLESRLELGGHLLDEHLTLGCPFGELGLDLGVDTRFEDGKTAILQLVLDLLDPEPVGEGDVDIQRLSGDPLLLFEPKGGDSPDVVKAVGELDQKNPHILGHRHHHLADGGRLGLLR